MTIRRREAKSGTRWDVEWLLPDGTKRSKTFKTLRAAKLFDGEVRSAREDGETVDPRGGKTELHVPRSFLSAMAWSSVMRSTLGVQRTVRGPRPAVVISLTHSWTFSRRIRPIGQLPNFGSTRGRQLSS
jgi:hypothetical protein